MLTVFVVLFLIIIIVISFSMNKEKFVNINSDGEQVSKEFEITDLYTPVDNNYGRYFRLRY